MPVMKTASEWAVLQWTILLRDEGFHWFNTVLWQEGNEGKNRVVSAATSRNHKKRKKPPPPSDGNARVELDLHADGAVFGKDCRVINDTGTVVSVDGFDPVSMKINCVPVVTVAVAYGCPTTGHTFILFFHQVLHVPTMTKHLINPHSNLQLRSQDQ